MVNQQEQNIGLAIRLMWYGGCTYAVLMLVARIFGDSMNIHGFSDLFGLVGSLLSMVAAGGRSAPGRHVASAESTAEVA
jgi:hypothetical protein